jgi:16S rRNA (guanine527-N7)-methyltransferase
MTDRTIGDINPELPKEHSQEHSQEPKDADAEKSIQDLMPSLPQWLECWQETLHWQPNETQQQQFQQLYQQILQGNRQLNLTRITEPDAFWEKHLWDSLSGIRPWLGEVGTLGQLPLMPPHAWAIDIGTGAGFPGIPIALVQPTWTVTLLDSTHKKMDFVQSLLTELGLKNGKLARDRVEQAGRQLRYRAAYDLATLRAVASAAVCAEYALPLLKLGGIAVLYRGQWTAEEAIGLESALEQLGGVLVAVETFKTPLSGSERHCLYLRKEQPTPEEFPRAIGVPTRMPL